MVPQEVKQCCAFTHHGAYMIVIETVIEQVRAPLLLQRWNMCHNVIMISERILWHSGKESACQCQRHKWCSFNLWVGKMPWRKEWQPTPVFLLGKSHGQRSLGGYSPWGLKESDMTEHRHTHTHTHSYTHVPDTVSIPRMKYSLYICRSSSQMTRGKTP